MEEQKRIYRYYDKINDKYVRVEVTDEVAKFLQNNTKQRQRQQEDCYDYNVSLNKVLYEDDDDNPITLEDVVPDRTDDEIREFCEKCFRNQRLYRCVWNVVDKLNEKEQKLVDDIYIYNKSQKEIADELGVSESAISQAHDRMLTHLAYFFYTDKEFMQMDLYKRNEREFKYSLMEVVKEMDKEEGLEINLNSVYDLVKDNTQMLKMISSLGIEINDTQKEIFTTMNRVVRQTLDDLNLDFGEQNILTVPQNLDMPDIRQLLKDLTKPKKKYNKDKNNN